MKKILTIAVTFLCMMSVAFSVSADELNDTVTNDSGLSSMHGINGSFEEYSEENKKIPSTFEAKQMAQVIRFTAGDIRKLYKEKFYIVTNPKDDSILLRIGHFSISVIQK